MGEIISIVNQKGGVGKTTTSVNLVSYLAKLKKKVLLVDVDPQANASSGLGVEVKKLSQGIYEALIGEKELNQVLTKPLKGKHKIAPASKSLAGAGVEMVNMENREFVLSKVLEEVRDQYDYIIIDAPPSLGLLTINSLTAADNLIIPIQSEYYALEGLSQLLETINLIQDNLKPNLGIKGALITMYDKRNKLSGLVMKELYQYFPNKIFDSVIPRSVRLAEAPSYGKSILYYDKRNKGARAYEKLAKEIIKLNDNI